ncbi:class I SAM-dependent methyltransferase [Oleispirillum naphthae]|uniref:class I SAM-dependent methyltransferase n=1 Tax=Oleispirillum naphthae TaxID=2838853 RepID=UPI003082624E
MRPRETAISRFWKSTFNGMAQDAAADALDEARLNAREAVTAEILLDLVAEATAEIPEGGLWADIGCATCQMARRFAERADGFVNIDLAESLLLLARHRFHPPRSSYVCADIGNLPFAPGSFRVVTTMGVLALIDDIEPALDGAMDLVAPGGMLVAEILNRRSLLYRLSLVLAVVMRRRFQPLRERDRLIRRYDLAEIERIVRRRAGWSIRLEPAFVTPFPRLSRFLAARPGWRRGLARSRTAAHLLPHAFLLVAHRDPA